MRKSSSGFTLVELILVVTIIGVLSAVLISTMNAETQRRRAQDAVNRSQMEQLAQGLESFYQSEGYYPLPEDGAPGQEVNQYLVKWPGAFYYGLNEDGSEFFIIVEVSNGNILKYSSVWGGLKVCAPTDLEIVDACDEQP